VSCLIALSLKNIRKKKKRRSKDKIIRLKCKLKSSFSKTIKISLVFTGKKSLFLKNLLSFAIAY
jgi:hypothetical protein